MAELEQVAEEVKREIARIGDDNKKLFDQVQKDLHDARQLAEGKAGADEVKAYATSMAEKFAALEQKVQQKMDLMGTALNRMGRSAGVANFDIPRPENVEALEFKRARMSFAGTPNDQLEDITVSDAEIAEYKGYRPAFRRYLRAKNEKLLSVEESKALTTGSDPDGGFFVTPAMSSRIMEIVRESSPMAQLAYVETIGTDRIEIPYDEGEGSGGWVGEEEARTETGTPQVGSFMIPADEIYTHVKATQRVLEDANVNVEEWLAKKNAEKFARIEATAFISGNGVKKPRGILGYTMTASQGSRTSGVQFYTTGDANLLKPDAIKKLPLLALKEPYHPNARWLMKRATLAAISIFRDDSGASAGTGQYLWVPGFRDNSVQSQLCGYPVSLADDMPAVAAGTYPIGFGDWRQFYTIVRRLGITTLRDPYTSKPFVTFYSRMRVGGGVTNFEAAVFLKVST